MSNNLLNNNTSLHAHEAAIECLAAAETLLQVALGNDSFLTNSPEIIQKYLWTIADYISQASNFSTMALQEASDGEGIKLR